MRGDDNDYYDNDDCYDQDDNDDNDGSDDQDDNDKNEYCDDNCHLSLRSTILHTPCICSAVARQSFTSDSTFFGTRITQKVLMVFLEVNLFDN